MFVLVPLRRSSSLSPCLRSWPILPFFGHDDSPPAAVTPSSAARFKCPNRLYRRKTRSPAGRARIASGEYALNADGDSGSAPDGTSGRRRLPRGLWKSGLPLVVGLIGSLIGI